MKQRIKNLDATKHNQPFIPLSILSKNYAVECAMQPIEIKSGYKGSTLPFVTKCP